MIRYLLVSLFLLASSRNMYSQPAITLGFDQTALAGAGVHLNLSSNIYRKHVVNGYASYVVFNPFGLSAFETIPMVRLGVSYHSGVSEDKTLGFYWGAGAEMLSLSFSHVDYWEAWGFLGPESGMTVKLKEKTLLNVNWAARVSLKPYTDAYRSSGGAYYETDKLEFIFYAPVTIGITHILGGKAE